MLVAADDLPEPLDPPGPELADKNRRILAERLHWPDDALEACEQISKNSPGWDVTWAPGGDLHWTEPGYYATHDHLYRGTGPRPWLYGATPDELRAAIADREPLCRYDLMELRDWTTDR